jgi:hypothetical protein
MRVIAMQLPKPKLEAPGDSLLAWTDEDQDVLEFRYKKHYAPDDERFADLLAYAIVQDDIDADAIWRAVVSCNTLREYDRMRTDWLIEQIVT